MPYNSGNSDYDFQGENHQGRDFRDILYNPNITGIKFQGAKLQKTNFQYVNLTMAEFQGAELACANLQSACLRETNFRGADLAYAILKFADIHESNFQEAKLHGANLKHCKDAYSANWQKAEYDHKTQFPDDFNILDRGLIRTRRNRKSGIIQSSIIESGEQSLNQTDVNITKALTEIRKFLQKRQGQEKFRKRLINLYQGRCAITGCDIEGVLEAAHIEPYCIYKTNDPKNGILLRADLHTLFDLNLIILHPYSKKIEIKESLQMSSYYKFHETTLQSHEENIYSPGDDFLMWRYQNYEQYIGKFLR